MLNQSTSVTLRVIELSLEWTQTIVCARDRIKFVPEQRLCQPNVHPTRLTWLIFRVTSRPGHCISQLAIFEKISATHLNCMTAFLLAWSHVPWPVRKTLTKHGIPPLELRCLNLGMLISLALAWNGIVQMHSSNNVTLFWLPGSGIIWNKSWLLKSHMAHAPCVKIQNVRR